MVIEGGKLMTKTVVTLCGAAFLVFTMAVLSFGQVQTTTTTKVQTVQNPDGTYTIVEYPVGKETVVTLTPVGIPGGAGTATILRAADGTTIKVNLTGLPADMSALTDYSSKWRGHFYNNDSANAVHALFIR
jgi:hypothetical protein